MSSAPVATAGGESASKPRVFSGIQPTSDSFHIGNYLGALRQWVALQDEYDAFYCVVDQHAITAEHVPAQTLRTRVRASAAQLLALGVDPDRSTLFVQSHVPAHAQLAWVLDCITGYGEAARMTQFKDKSTGKSADTITVGLFAYPMLMAADILLYRTDQVPVGEDQRQHLELSRTLAQRFNHRYDTDLFVLPQAYIPKVTAKIYDLQVPGGKMGKSNSAPAGILNLMDDPKISAKKLRSAVTDSLGEVTYDLQNQPGLANLVAIGAGLAGQTPEEFVQPFAGGGYGDLKKAVAQVFTEFITPVRERALEYLGDPAELDRVLDKGAERAKVVADDVLARVYEAVGF